MRKIFLSLASLLFLTNAALANPAPATPNLITTGTISLDDKSLSIKGQMTTIAPEQPGYSALRISFYPFVPSSDDLKKRLAGDVDSLTNESYARHFDLPSAVLLLSVDKNFHVQQINMEVPGFTCTIAPHEADRRSFLQTYNFDGKNLFLKSKGSFTCDMSFMKPPKMPKFSWDIDLSTEVYPANINLPRL